MTDELIRNILVHCTCVVFFIYREIKMQKTISEDRVTQNGFENKEPKAEV